MALGSIKTVSQAIAESSANPTPVYTTCPPSTAPGGVVKPEDLRGSDRALYEELRALRLRIARQEEKPAFVIFHDKTIAEIVVKRPRTEDELSEIWGIATYRLENYGAQVLEVVQQFENGTQSEANDKPSAERQQDEIDIYLSRIAAKIADYWAFDTNEVSSQHILEWSNQFDNYYSSMEQRRDFLRETAWIIDKYYFEQADVKDFLSRTFLSHNTFAGNGSKTVREISFRDQQTYGNSQLEMLELLDEILEEAYGISHKDCGGSNVHCYLDDVIYSGNRVLNDLREWIEKESIQNATILVVCFVRHKEGFAYFKECFKETCKEHDLTCKLIMPNKEVDNRRARESKMEFFWPSEVPDDPEMREYIDRLENDLSEIYRPKPLLRPKGWPHTERVFSTPEGRRIVENLMLKASFDIWKSLPRKEEMRPFGFDKLTTLGFGSLIATYRNMANNCPLAYWFDGSEFGHPWVPLLPRKVVNRREDRWWL